MNTVRQARVAPSFARPSTRSIRRAARVRRAAFEPLLARVLLAIDISPNGFMTVTGTAGDDVLTGVVGPGIGEYTLTLNGVAETFQNTQFFTITVDLGDGDDSADLSTNLRKDVRVNGGDGNDTLVTTRGNDRLDGGAGNDSLVAGSGVNQISDGAGDDVVVIPDFATLFAGPGSDEYVARTVDGTTRLPKGYSISFEELQDVYLDMALWGTALVRSDADDSLLDTDTFAGNPTTLTGTNGDDLLVGSSDDNVIFGGGGGDTLRGMGGNDVLESGDAEGAPGSGDNDLLDGGSGNDTLTGGLGAETILAGSGDDVVFARLAGGRIDLASGNDRATVEFGGPSGTPATVLGGSGDDEIQSDVEGVVAGGTGNDVLRTGGTAGDATTFSGGPGNDRFDLYAMQGDGDVYQGNGGTDTMTFLQEPARISVDGQANDGTVGSGRPRGDNVGNDIEVFHASTRGDRIHAGGRTTKTILIGNFGDDTLTGGSGADSIVGHDGADVLNGGAGNDVIRGGGGADTITGGAGSDLLDGDLGYDAFLAADGAADVIRGKGGAGDTADQDEGLDVLTSVESTT